MTDQVYVQSISLKLKKKDGEIIQAKFTGLAMCSPQEWEEVKRMSLGQAMQGVENPLIITDPKPVDELITEDSDYHDVVDAIRIELREHHSKLSE